jgi:hypothetical protein
MVALDTVQCNKALLAALNYIYLHYCVDTLVGCLAQPADLWGAFLAERVAGACIFTRKAKWAPGGRQMDAEAPNRNQKAINNSILFSSTLRCS